MSRPSADRSRVRSPGLGLRHRQRGVGQDRDPGVAGGAAVAAVASIRRRILCVTYTKAAAAEMQRRLFATLGEWAVLSDDKLARRLADLEGTPGAAFDEAALSRRAPCSPARWRRPAG